MSDSRLQIADSQAHAFPNRQSQIRNLRSIRNLSTDDKKLKNAQLPAPHDRFALTQTCDPATICSPLISDD